MCSRLLDIGSCCMQVVLQALVAEVQATEEFLIPPQLHAGINTDACLEHTHLLVTSAVPLCRARSAASW